MTLIAVAVLYFGIAGVYLIRLSPTRWLLNPGPLFVAQQSLFFAGILPLVDTSVPADQVYLLLSVVTLCLFVVANLFAQSLWPVSKSAAAEWNRRGQQVESGTAHMAFVYLMIALCLIVSALYYSEVGYNLVWDSTKLIIGSGGQLVDTATLRLQSYAGDRYLAPGYVNQFKNTLLPLLLAYLWARGYLRRDRMANILALVPLPICVAFLLGNGQRWPLVSATASAAFFLATVLPTVRRRLILSGVIGAAIALLLLSTLVLGRTVNEVESASDVADLGGEVIDRFTSGNQRATVDGFRLIYGLPPKGLDGEWVAGIATLVPGHDRSRISLGAEVFSAYYGGSNRGTAPPSLWVFAWNDFGPIGILITPLSLGLCYQRAYATLVRGRKNLSRVAAYAALTVVLGSWAVGGIESPVNDGLLTLFILLAIFKMIPGIARSSDKTIDQTVHAPTTPRYRSAAPLISSRLLTRRTPR